MRPHAAFLAVPPRGLTRGRGRYLYDTALSGTLPSQLGQLSTLTFLNLPDNSISGNLPSEIGRCTALEDLDVYNNPLTGDLPSSIQHLINLRTLYVPNELLLPVRLRYCQRRLPNVGKYNYRIVQQEYLRMASSLCPEPYDTLTAFGTLSQISGDV